MASKGVIVVVSGEDKTGEVFAAVQKHLKATQEQAKTCAESMKDSMRDFQESIMLMRDAFVLDRVFDVFKEIVKSSVELGMELGHLAQQTGISTQNLSVLRYASQQTGVEFEVLTKGFKKMSETFYMWEHGSKTAGEAFASIHISMQDVKNVGGDMYKVLEMVADKFQQMPNGITKNAVATQLFGRAGQALIPVLNQGSDGIEKYRAQAEKLGLVLDKVAVQKMEKLHAAEATLSAAVEAGGLAFTDALAQALEGVSEAFTDLTGKSNLWAEVGKQVGLTIIPLAAMFSALGQNIRETIDEFTNAKAAFVAWDSSIGEHLDWTAEQRSAAAVRHAAALQIMHDSKADHDAAEAEEKQFNDKMLALKRAVEAPDTSSPTDKFMRFARDGNVLGAFGAGGIDNTAGPSAAGGQRAPSTPNPFAGGDMSVHDPFTSIVQQAQSAMQDAAAVSQKAAADAAAAWEQMGEDSIKAVSAVFPATPSPNVVLAAKNTDLSSIDNEAEKFAHGVFDPLFDLGMKWDQQWKHIRANMLKDLGQTAESQLFGALFGDSSGRGGKGWDGSGGDSHKNGHNGLLGEGLGAVSGLLGSLFKKPSATSNGGMGGGAGTIPSAAASLMQIGKSVAGGATAAGGGIQVIMNNNGTPQEVTQTSSSGGGGPEAMLIQLFTKDLTTNGPLSQGIRTMMMI